METAPTATTAVLRELVSGDRLQLQVVGRNKTWDSAAEPFGTPLPPPALTLTLTLFLIVYVCAFFALLSTGSVRVFVCGCAYHTLYPLCCCAVANCTVGSLPGSAYLQTAACGDRAPGSPPCALSCDPGLHDWRGGNMEYRCLPTGGWLVHPIPDCRFSFLRYTSGSSVLFALDTGNQSHSEWQCSGRVESFVKSSSGGEVMEVRKLMTRLPTRLAPFALHGLEFGTPLLVVLRCSKARTTWNYVVPLTTNYSMTHPGAVGTPTANAVRTTGGAIRISLLPPIDTGGAHPFHRFGSYEVFVNNTKGNGTRQQDTQPAWVGGADCALGSLNAHTWYELRIFALNTVSRCFQPPQRWGLSSNVTVYLVKTGAPSVPEPPPPPQVLHTTGGMVRVGVPITKFTVNVSGSAFTVDCRGESTEYTVSMPLAGESRSFHYLAHNAIGDSEPSVAVVLRSLNTPTLPSAPSVHVQRRTGGSLLFSLSSVDTGGAPVLYKVWYQPLSANPFAPWLMAPPTPGSFTMVPGLSNSTTVRVRVSAWNVIGDGAVSVVEEATTETTAPGGPYKCRNVSTMPGRVELTWKQLDTGGVPLLRFDVLLGGKLITSVDRAAGGGPLLPLVDILVHLSGPEILSGPLTLQLNSTNEQQLWSLWDWHVEVASPPHKPDSVSNVRLEGVGPNFLEVAWDPPASFGGAKWEGYTITVAGFSTPFRIQGGHLPLLRIPPRGTEAALELNTSYSVSVAAVTKAGPSLVAPVVFKTLAQAQAPSAPLPPLVIVPDWVSSNDTHISWAGPLDTGGDPVLDYSLCFAVNPSSLLCESFTCLRTAWTNHTVVPIVPPGSTFAVCVRARNAIQLGAGSPVTSTVIPQLPGTPLAPRVACVSQQQALLKWEPPGDDGVPIARYTVEEVSGAELCTRGPSVRQCRVSTPSGRNMTVLLRTWKRGGGSSPLLPHRSSDAVVVSLLQVADTWRCWDQQGSWGVPYSPPHPGIRHWQFTPPHALVAAPCVDIHGVQRRM